VANHLAKEPAAQYAVRVSEERELVLAFQSGESAAGESIHQRYRPMVRSICGRLLQDPEDIQEAVQETFLRALGALPRFNGSYQLGAWIARIARNVCLDQIRARNRLDGRTRQVENLEESSQPDWSGDPQEVLLRSVESRRVFDVLAALPRRYRAAIILRDLQGLTYGEIATALSIPRYQVKNFLHRGRKAFRQLWHAAAGFLALPTRLGGHVAKAGVKPASRLDTWPKIQHFNASIITQAGEVAARTPVLESGHWILERAAAVTVAVTLFGMGPAGTSWTKPAPLPDRKPDSVAQQPVHIEANAVPRGTHRGGPIDDRLMPRDDEGPAVVEPTEEAAVEPTEEAAVEPNEEAAVEPTAEAVVEPNEEAAVEPNEEAAVEPNEEAAVEPTAEAVVEPTAEAVVEPTAEAAVEDVHEQGSGEERDRATMRSVRPVRTQEGSPEHDPGSTVSSVISNQGLPSSSGSQL
jgi:RNA polymerase sigma-70 factor (ECF subfamily)